MNMIKFQTTVTPEEAEEIELARRIDMRNRASFTHKALIEYARQINSRTDEANAGGDLRSTSFVTTTREAK